MKFYNPLYIDFGIGKIQKRRILRAFKKKKPILGIYCLCAREDSLYLLEIMTMEELFRGYYSLNNVLIFGFAKGKEEALMIAKNVVASWYLNKNSKEESKIRA
ncbi:MAG: hypothetical protein GX347_04355 [Epulopiscium sp.]|nr:hypothetical protein [Candidatus Epulonipiscium sp.]